MVLHTLDKSRTFRAEPQDEAFLQNIKKVQDKGHAGIVIVDVQVKLMAVMSRRETVAGNIVKLLHLSRLFNLPVIVTEQYPRMMGSTLPEIKGSVPACLTDGSQAYSPVEKMDFDCCAVENFNSHLKSAGLKTIILTGVETHVCILQTCMSLLSHRYNVHVPQDAVDSRTEENWHVGLELMKKAGAVITSTETVIFQLLKKAGTKEFKEMLKLIK